MTENALSILIAIFSIQLQQTEISERKLFIFHQGNSGHDCPVDFAATLNDTIVICEGVFLLE